MKLFYARVFNKDYYISSETREQAIEKLLKATHGLLPPDCKLSEITEVPQDVKVL